jgi:prepilin-type N-terminal cleavage/methylation domain-containing protein
MAMSERLSEIRNKPPSTCVHAACKKGRKRMKLNNSRKAGFTLVEIMIVVAIIGLLAAIAIPNFVKARTASQKAACIANMKQIDGAKNTWALEQKKQNTDSPADTDLFDTDKYIREKPQCPGGGTYAVGTVITKPTCTRSVTPDFHTL